MALVLLKVAVVILEVALVGLEVALVILVFCDSNLNLFYIFN